MYLILLGRLRQPLLQMLGVNIEMNDRTEGIAYNMIDLDQDLDQSTIDQLLGVDGVVRVRQLPIHSS